MPPKYKVLIPTAGVGSRLGELTRYLNKSLLDIGNRPTISHVIEQFPLNTEFVIALGYKGELVREFLEITYPERKFYFVDVNLFEGAGSGLGLSMLLCKDYLQEPFVFTSCDTLVKGKIPDLEHNWMGYADVSNYGQYRTLDVDSDGRVMAINEKGKIGRVYIGLAGIRDYHTFWKALEDGEGDAIFMGEVYGLRGLLEKSIWTHKFEWYDTGNLEALAQTRKTYHNPDAPNILEKKNEAIWFVDGKVIKFCGDEKFITNRVRRAEILKGYVPEIVSSKPHMYCYDKVDGTILSECITLPLFMKLLDYSQEFWKKRDDDIFNICMKFYKDKTMERVELFYKNFGKKDGTESINGEEMPTLRSLLDNVDWEWISAGMAGRYHGDYHFENILYSDKGFTFLDWRQDFGGNLEVGDIYYDMAKLSHGLIICHELINKNMFSVKWGKEIEYDFYRKQILVECEKVFEGWMYSKGYNALKVKVLTALIFLNIAALHHYPYSLLLYALGKKMLNELI